MSLVKLGEQVIVPPYTIPRRLMRLAPHLEPYIQPHTTMIYVPGKRDPTVDELESRELASMLGAKWYSMGREALPRSDHIVGDFRKYDYSKIVKCLFPLLNGVFGDWSVDGNQHFDILERGLDNARKIIDPSDLTLLLYVNQDLKRFCARHNTGSKLSKFIHLLRESYNNRDIIEFFIDNDLHLFFYPCRRLF